MAEKNFSIPVLGRCRNEDIQDIREEAAKNGVFLSVSRDGMLNITVDTNWWETTKRKNERGAGRKKDLFYITDKEILMDSNEIHEAWTYAYFVYFLQQKTDKELMEYMHTSLYRDPEKVIAPATYYRHKKRVLDSTYYKSLDQSKIDDLEYLKGMPGGHRLF